MIAQCEIECISLAVSPCGGPSSKPGHGGVFQERNGTHLEKYMYLHLMDESTWPTKEEQLRVPVLSSIFDFSGIYSVYLCNHRETNYHGSGYFWQWALCSTSLTRREFFYTGKGTGHKIIFINGNSIRTIMAWYKAYMFLYKSMQMWGKTGRQDCYLIHVQLFNSSLLVARYTTRRRTSCGRSRKVAVFIMKCRQIGLD